jgi:hypothetical protein
MAPKYSRTFFAATSIMALALAGCDVGGGATPNNPNEHDPDANNLPDGPIITGNLITADETWSGTKTLDETVTIAAGVTVTVSPGTIISGAALKNIRVRGTLKMVGTAASRITLKSTTGVFSGIVVEAGGTADVAFFDAEKIATVFFVHQTGTLTLDSAVIKDVNKAVDVGGGTATVTKTRVEKMASGGLNMMGGSLTIRDSVLLQSTGDIVIAYDGNLTIEYSDIGGAAISDEHCNLHFGGNPVLKVNNNNIHASSFGLMFYGGTNADFQRNNWFNNTNDVDTSGPLNGRTGNFANGFFEKAPTPMAGANYTPMSTVRLTDAGPRL